MADDKTTKTPEQPVTDSGPGKETSPFSAMIQKYRPQSRLGGTLCKIGSPLLSFLLCSLCTPLQSILFAIALMYLRAYTNGHHAKSYLSCLINSCVIELLGVFLCNYFTPVISLCLAIGSSITILLVAPINNEQIHFSEKELAAVRTVCHKRLAILFVLHIVLLLILPISAYCISLAMSADAFLLLIATVYKGNIIKNLIMDCQSYTKYRPNETTGGIFVSWRRKEELPTGA